jgi:predicted acyltransferase
VTGWLSANLQAFVPGAPGALLFAILYMLVCWLFAWLLHRNRIVIKV